MSDSFKFNKTSLDQALGRIAEQLTTNPNVGFVISTSTTGGTRSYVSKSGYQSRSSSSETTGFDNHEVSGGFVPRQPFARGGSRGGATGGPRGTGSRGGSRGNTERNRLGSPEGGTGGYKSSGTRGGSRSGGFVSQKTGDADAEGGYKRTSTSYGSAGSKRTPAKRYSTGSSFKKSSTSRSSVSGFKSKGFKKKK